MKIRLLHGISGSSHRDCATGRGYEGLPADAVIDLPAEHAERYVNHKHAEAVDDKTPVTHRPS